MTPGHQHRSSFTMAVMLDHFCFHHTLDPICVCLIVAGWLFLSLMQMRATVHEVATYFPTAIISGRGRQKVCECWQHSLQSYYPSLPDLLSWGSESILEVYFRSFTTGKGWKMVSCDIIQGSGNTKLLCWDSPTGGSLTGLWICTTTGAVLCRKSWHGHHGACWWL
jgi:hypothetical protein